MKLKESNFSFRIGRWEKIYFESLPVWSHRHRRRWSLLCQKKSFVNISSKTFDHNDILVKYLRYGTYVRKTIFLSLITGIFCSDIGIFTCHTVLYVRSGIMLYYVLSGISLYGTVRTVRYRPYYETVYHKLRFLLWNHRPNMYDVKICMISAYQVNIHFNVQWL